MEELLYFMVIVLIGALIVIPIILLVNLSSANSKLNLLQKEIKNLNDKLHYVVNNMANKQDIQYILKTAADSTTTVKKEETVKEQETQPKATPIETVVPMATPLPSKEEPVQKPTIEEETKPSPKPDIEKEQIVPQPKVENAPAYAAIEKPASTPSISTPTRPQSPVKPRTETVENYQNPLKDLAGRIFGDNWLSKVGIVTLVLGVGFFVKYAIDQNWINEIGRVGIGIITGALIIGIAHKLKEKYHVFSSLLVGGGISIFYITITLAFREYEIFSQPVAFVLLTIITIFSVILSLFYNRQELAIFSLIGGFGSPLMVSTGSGNYIVLFTFILILNTGMLFISLKRNWKLVGIVSYVLSLIFFWTWLGISFEEQFAGATIFASLFFAQFYILAIIKHFREDKNLSTFQAVLILTNNLSILFALMYIFNLYEYDVRGLAVMAIAVVNAAVMLTLFRNAKVDKNLIYLVIGVVMSFVTLAIPIQLEGYVITMFWAAEMVLLLWLWQRSKINIFRLGFLALSLLTIVSYLMDVNSYYIDHYHEVSLTPFLNGLFITGIVIVIGFALSLFLLSKENAEDIITIRGKETFSIKNIKYLFKFALTILLFSVFYLEFNYQLEVHTDTTYSQAFRYVSLATYTTCFVAGLAILFRNKINSTKYFFFLGCVVIYSLLYSFLVAELRSDIFFTQEYSSGYFLIHLISLPAIGYLIYLLVVNIRPLMQEQFKVIAWGLVILSYIILSVELDNLVIWISNNPETYFDRLYDVHTFGYPILWGAIAMVLMIWGLKQKEVLLRQISLISFGLIIVKFYAFDAWRMSQTGLIISFVVLGAILLVVSFMQQKIKTLVKDDDEKEVLDDKNKES